MEKIIFLVNYIQSEVDFWQILELFAKQMMCEHLGSNAEITRIQPGLPKKIDVLVIIYPFLIGLNTLLVYGHVFFSSRYTKESDDYCSSSHSLF